MNLRPVQPGIAIYQRREVHGIVHDVEQVGLMLTGWMRDGGVVHTVMRCMNDETWETTISRNKPEVVDG